LQRRGSGDIEFYENSDRFYNLETTDHVLGELMNILKNEQPGAGLLIIGNTGSDGKEKDFIYGNSDKVLKQDAI